jgi:hypothetical protein
MQGIVDNSYVKACQQAPQARTRPCRLGLGKLRLLFVAESVVHIAFAALLWLSKPCIRLRLLPSPHGRPSPRTCDSRGGKVLSKSDTSDGNYTVGSAGRDDPPLRWKAQRPTAFSMLALRPTCRVRIAKTPPSRRVQLCS